MSPLVPIVIDSPTTCRLRTVGPHPFQLMPQLLVLLQSLEGPEHNRQAATLYASATKQHDAGNFWGRTEALLRATGTAATEKPILAIWVVFGSVKVASTTRAIRSSTSAQCLFVLSTSYLCVRVSGWSSELYSFPWQSFIEPPSMYSGILSKQVFIHPGYLGYGSQGCRNKMRIENCPFINASPRSPLSHVRPIPLF